MANKSKQTGLGKGFDSLIPKDLIGQEFEESDGIRPKNLLIQDVVPNPNQPRNSAEDDSLAELAESIKLHGILQPIMVVRDNDKYLIIAGERRWRAAQMAGLERVPALIRQMNDQLKLELALIENVQREDLTPLELAEAFYRLNTDFKIRLEEIARRVGKARSTVSNTTRLLKLPPAAKRALKEGKITVQHARAILALEGKPRKQQELLDLILKHKWTPNRAEQFVIALKEGKKSVAQARKTTESTNAETKAIAKKLKTKVNVRKMAKGGQLIIRYKNDKDFKRIYKLLS